MKNGLKIKDKQKNFIEKQCMKNYKKIYEENKNMKNGKKKKK
jgi:hypothetical protein